MLINFSNAPDWFRNYLFKEYIDEMHEACQANDFPGKDRPKFLKFVSEWFNSKGCKTHIENSSLIFDVDDKWVTFAALRYYED